MTYKERQLALDDVIADFKNKWNGTSLFLADPMPDRGLYPIYNPKTGHPTTSFGSCVILRGDDGREGCMDSVTYPLDGVVSLGYGYYMGGITISPTAKPEDVAALLNSTVKVMLGLQAIRNTPKGISRVVAHAQYYKARVTRKIAALRAA